MVTVEDTKSETTFDPCEALTAIAVGAARADGSVLPCEAARLEHTLSSLAVFHGLSAEAFRAIVDRVARQVSDDNGGSMVRRAAAALPPQLRGTAFAIGVDILLSDGRMRASERRFVEDLRRLLRLRRSFAAKVLGVLQTKNYVWPRVRSATRAPGLAL